MAFAKCKMLFESARRACGMHTMIDPEAGEELCFDYGDSHQLDDLSSGSDDEDAPRLVHI